MFSVHCQGNFRLHKPAIIHYNVTTDGSNDNTSTVYDSKQSPGYLWLQLGAVQTIFLLSCILLIFIGSQLLSANDGNSSFHISQTELFLILAVITVQLLVSMTVYLRWRSAEYLIGARELQIRSGFMLKDTQSIELSMIAGCKTHQGLAGSFLHYGDVKVGLRTKNTLTLAAVPEPDQFVTRLEAGVANFGNRIV